MKGKTKKWISGILSLAMLASVSVATSKLLVHAAEETTTQTATVSNVDTTTTNAAWQKSYGKNGYIVMAGSVTDDKKDDNNRVNFYSDMYAEKTGTEIIVAANTMKRSNGNSQYTYLTSGDEMSYGLNETAPISKWGMSTLGWSLRTDFNGNRTLAIPGSTTDYTYAGVLNANTHDMSIYFTKTSESKELVTVYASSMNNLCSGSAPITVAAYSGSTTYVHMDQAVAAKDFYTSKGLTLLASTDITSAGYVTFEIEGAGDYQIAVYDAAKSNRPSIQGIFFDEYVAPVEQTATFVALDRTTTNADWQANYGKNGYIVMGADSTKEATNWRTDVLFYSDLYQNADGTTLIQAANTTDRANGQSTYTTVSGDSLKADAPITQWGYATKGWFYNLGNYASTGSLLIPGATDATVLTNYAGGQITNPNNKTNDVSVYFTKSDNTKKLVTLYIADNFAYQELWSAVNSVTVGVYFTANKKVNTGGTDLATFYGTPELTAKMTESGYISFLLEGAGDYQFVVSSDVNNKVRPSIQGVFFDDVGTKYSVTRSITLSEDIAFNYYVTPDDAYTDYSMVCTMNGESVSLSGTYQGGKYKFTFKGITPQYLTADVTAVLRAKNAAGEVVELFTQTESVKDYCTAILSDSAYATYHNVVIDLLQYGAAAQMYTGTNTDALANADLTDAQVGVTFDESQITSVSTIDNNVGNAVTFKGARLYFDNKVGVQTAFTIDGVGVESLEGYKAVITLNGVEKEISTFGTAQIDGTPVFTIDFTGIAAYDYDTAFTVVVKDAKGNVVSGTLTYSVNSFIKNNSKHELYQALWCYGVSAKAIVNGGKAQ